MGTFFSPPDGADSALVGCSVARRALATRSRRAAFVGCGEGSMHPCGQALAIAALGSWPSVSGLSPACNFRSALPSHSCRGCCTAVEDQRVPATAVSMCGKVRPRCRPTRSPSASKMGGTATSRALAVLKLMTSSNLVGCSTGRSAARRNWCGKFGAGSLLRVGKFRLCPCPLCPVPLAPCP